MKMMKKMKKGAKKLSNTIDVTKQSYKPYNQVMSTTKKMGKGDFSKTKINPKMK